MDPGGKHREHEPGLGGVDVGQADKDNHGGQQGGDGNSQVPGEATELRIDRQPWSLDQLGGNDP